MISKINVIRYTDSELTIISLTIFITVLVFVIGALLDNRQVR